LHNLATSRLEKIKLSKERLIELSKKKKAAIKKREKVEVIMEGEEEPNVSSKVEEQAIEEEN
jgi:hypothetical protein